MILLTLSSGRIIEIRSAETFMHGIGLKVIYLNGKRELFCVNEWVSVMRRN